MQIKITTSGTVGKFKRIEKAFFKEAFRQIQKVSEVEISKTRQEIPFDTTSLRKSYVVRVLKNMIRVGSQGEGFNPLVYAEWIETGRRKLGGKTITRRGSKGIGAFKKFKEKIKKEIPKAIRLININRL